MSKKINKTVEEYVKDMIGFYQQGYLDAHMSKNEGKDILKEWKKIKHTASEKFLQSFSFQNNPILQDILNNEKGGEQK